MTSHDVIFVTNKQLYTYLCLKMFSNIYVAVPGAVRAITRIHVL